MAHIITTLSQKISEKINSLYQRLDGLAARERLALAIMVIFLTLATLGALLWYPHQAAQKQQQRLNDLTATAQWMQSNAAQLPNTPYQDTTLGEKVQRIAQQQGLTLQLQDAQEQIRLSTSSPQYAVLANFMTQLAAQGVSIIGMTLQKQPDGSLQLSLTVQ